MIQFTIESNQFAELPPLRVEEHAQRNAVVLNSAIPGLQQPLLLARRVSH